MPKIEYLEIESIRFDPATQPRASIDEGTVEEYRETIEASDPKEAPVFREVVVYFDGSDRWLADGYHRVLAHKAAGREKINAHVFKGTKRDAILHAVGANNDHGLRRSNADKRKAVTTLLNDPEWAKWSDSEIARRCKVGQPFVSSLHRELESAPNLELGARPRLTGDGRVMNTANLGRKPSTNGHAAVAPPPKSKPQTRVVEDKSEDFDASDFYQPDPEDAAAEAERSAAAPEPSLPKPFVVPSHPATVNHPTSLVEREPGDEEEPEGDDDWLNTLPLSRMLFNEPLKTFCADAVIYRRFLATRQTIREPAGLAFGNLRRSGAFGSTLHRLMKAEHPRHWHKCPPTRMDEGAGCDGHGFVVGVRCTVCFGRGYLLFPPGRPR